MIKINDIEIPMYPSSYDDSPSVVKTDSYAIDGSLERQQYPSKKQVKMSFPMANPSVYAFFNAFFEGESAVKFYNDTSKYGVLEFTGIITACNPGEYIRGGSLLFPLEITIREV